MELKRLNRFSLHLLHSKTATLETARLKVERAENSLKNLLYEKSNLLREIALCKDYTPTSLKALSAAEGASPEKSGLIPNLSEPKTAAEHTANLKIITDVQAKRRALKQELTLSVENKRQKTTISSSTNDFLQSIPTHLTNIEAACKPLQEFLELKNSDRDSHLKARTVLCKELYVLFCHLDAAGEKVQVVDAPVQCTDLSKASAYLKEENGEAWKEEEAQVLVPYPSAVQLSLEETVLTFSFLPELEIVTCLGAEPALLSGLFPADLGLVTPNESSHHKFKDYNGGRGVVIPPEGAFPGRPFVWCQWLSGMYFLVAKMQVRDTCVCHTHTPAFKHAFVPCSRHLCPRQTSTRLEPSVRSILQQLSARVSGWRSKAAIISDIFGMVARGDDAAEGGARVVAVDEAAGQGDGRVLEISVKDGVGAVVKISVKILPAYPTVVPEWDLIQGKEGEGGYDMNLKSLQTAVNTMEGGNEDVLRTQLKELLEGIGARAGGKDWGEVGGMRVRKGRERSKLR